MIDELEFAFDDHPERGRYRSRHRRGAGRSRRGGGRSRTVAALLLSLVLLAGLAGGVWYGYDRVSGIFGAPDYTTGGTGQVVVEVSSGDTATDIANTLVKADVVKSAKSFVNAADDDTRSKNIQAGSYRLRTKMRATDALAMLLDLKNKVVTKVTIPEGRSAKQTFDLLAKATGIPAAQFATAAKDPRKLGVPDFWFTRTDGKKVTRSIEGFLFPATYEFDPDPTAEEILSEMVEQFIAVTTELKFVERVEAERGGIAPYEALMVASLAQAEAGVPKDIGKVARVAYNRLYGDSPELGCACLEMDVTINYWFELQGRKTKASKDLLESELNDARNPYNTKVHAGLPPTPINNPGELALQGAMDPPDGEWIYFVAIDKKGNSAFATTHAEQLRNEETARQNGVL